jgi:hypothetical protein
MTISKKEQAEADRAARHAEAKKKWKELTAGDEWPEEEHQLRFETLLTVICTKPRNAR